MLKLIKRSVLALESITQSLLILSLRMKDDTKKTEKKTPRKYSTGLYVLECVETGRRVSGCTKTGVLTAAKLGVGGHSCRSLASGKTIKSTTTGLHYKAVAGF